MKTFGWAVQVEIPLADLGRVRLPHYRIRYQTGWVRIGYNALRTHIIATLEDREGKLLPALTQTGACAMAAVMGKVICWHLMKHNRYEPGEPVGDRELVQMAVA